jgi:hypothetical protein
MNNKLKMVGICLVVVGIICLGTGIFLLAKSRNRQPETCFQEQTASIISENKNIAEEKANLIRLAIADGVLTDNEKVELRNFAKKNLLNEEEIISEAEEQIKKLSTNKEVETIDYNQKNGIDFEKYIVGKFSENHFSIKKWRGDKYIKGRYAEDTPEPDLLLELKLKGNSAIFAVECKWRKKYYKGGFEFSQKEFDKYKQYETENNIPVFVVIGIGATGENPEKLYVIRFKGLQYPFLNGRFLSSFEKDKIHNFYFDMEKKELK